MAMLESRIEPGPGAIGAVRKGIPLAAGVLTIVGGICFLLLTSAIFLPLFFMSIGHGLLLFALWRDRQVGRDDPLWRLGVLFFCISIVFLGFGILEFT
jgi:hypothetical protein